MFEVCIIDYGRCYCYCCLSGSLRGCEPVVSSEMMTTLNRKSIKKCAKKLNGIQSTNRSLGLKWCHIAYVYIFSDILIAFLHPKLIKIVSKL